MVQYRHSRRIILIFCGASVFCSVFALGWLLAVPSEVGSAGMLGYSWCRLAAALLPAAAALTYLYLAIRIAQDTKELPLTSRIMGFLEQGYPALWIWIIALLGYIIGVIFLVIGLPLMGGPYYSPRIFPLAVWLSAFSLLNLLFLSLLVGGYRLPKFSHMVFLLIILLASVLVTLYMRGFSAALEEDIYSTYTEGHRLLYGVNPYERVLEGDMHENSKYATYFPISYYFSWWSQAIGLREFTAWVSFWRLVFLIFNLLIASLLFFLPERDGFTALAVFAILFWCFNRWTLHVVRTFDIDFPPVFFMLLSLVLFKRNRLASYLLLGLSLGIKQMGIFLVPLYLIWTWQESDTNRLRNLVVALLAISSIPLITSLPFIAWNAEGFIKSITFSASRDPAAVFRAYSLDTLLGVGGFYSKIFLLTLLGLVYWIEWKGSLGRYLSAFLVMIVFVYFNSVLFTSYMVWIVPLIPLAAYQVLHSQTHKLAGA